jgi:hypothetical protein
MGPVCVVATYLFDGLLIFAPLRVVGCFDLLIDGAVEQLAVSAVVFIECLAGDIL